ncbi:MAG: nuclear transport factor 2 family protein [Croceibacterium sp.]
MGIKGWLAIALALAPVTQLSAKAAPLTAQALSDRAQVEDLLTRYYWNFGNSKAESFGEYYAPDAEFVLGKTTYKGVKAIEGMYAAVPKDVPQRSSFALNILISNMLVTMHGNTATARLVFTETITKKQGDAPAILTQGREFDQLVKLKGRWLISKRQVMGANGIPDGWQD